MWGIEYSKTKKMEIFDLLDDKRVNFRKLDQQETCMLYYIFWIKKENIFSNIPAFISGKIIVYKV